MSVRSRVREPLDQVRQRRSGTFFRTEIVGRVDEGTGTKDGTEPRGVRNIHGEPWKTKRRERVQMEKIRCRVRSVDRKENRVLEQVRLLEKTSKKGVPQASTPPSWIGDCSK